MSRYHFTGEGRHDDHVARYFKGEESSLKACTQYVDYAVDVRRNQYAQSMSGRHEATNTYHFLVEVGRHTAVEALVNMVAAAAGLNGVQAYGA